MDMITEYRCTVNKSTKEFVRLIPIYTSSSGQIRPRFSNDKLNSEEEFVPHNTVPHFLKPIWNGTTFEEGATKQELEELETSKIPPSVSIAMTTEDSQIALAELGMYVAELEQQIEELKKNG